jgi:hypothetical protein
MTQLLKRAFEEAAKLAPEAQDALARALLHDLESEHSWTLAFTGSEADSLGRLADEAIAEHRRGDTKPLDL